MVSSNGARPSIATGEMFGCKLHQLQHNHWIILQHFLQTVRAVEELRHSKPLLSLIDNLLSQHLSVLWLQWWNMLRGRGFPTPEVHLVRGRFFFGCKRCETNLPFFQKLLPMHLKWPLPKNLVFYGENLYSSIVTTYH